MFHKTKIIGGTRKQNFENENKQFVVKRKINFLVHY